MWYFLSSTFLQSVKMLLIMCKWNVSLSETCLLIDNNFDFLCWLCCVLNWEPNFYFVICWLSFALMWSRLWLCSREIIAFLSSHKPWHSLWFFSQTLFHFQGVFFSLWLCINSVVSVRTTVASMDFRAVFLSLKFPKPDRSQIKWVASSNIFINKSTGQESFLLFLSFVYSCICVCCFVCLFEIWLVLFWLDS